MPPFGRPHTKAEEGVSDAGDALFCCSWSRLGSNQRPSRCERDALPLSHGTETRQTCTLERVGTLTRPTGRTKISASRIAAAPTLDGRRSGSIHTEFTTRSLDLQICEIRGWSANVLNRTTENILRDLRGACGRGAAGSAQPCQGWGRGFESRRPLERLDSTFTVEWPSGEATACKAVHTGSIPVSTSRD